MRAITDPTDAPEGAAPTIVAHALKENKRPIGFAPWPEKKKAKKAKRAKPV